MLNYILNFIKYREKNYLGLSFLVVYNLTKIVAKNNIQIKT